MKILFGIDKYFPSRGGAERYLRDLAEALCRRGHLILLAAMEAESDGITEKILLQAPPFPRVIREAVFARKLRKLKDQGIADRMIGFRHVLDAHLFQPHEGLFLDSMRGAIRPVSSLPLIRHMAFMKKMLSLKNLFFLYADHVLFRNNPQVGVAALSEMSAASIRRRYGAQIQVRVIPNGVDLNRYHPGLKDTHEASVRERYSIDPEKRILLFAAHNFKLKGLREALNGVATFIHGGGNPVLLVAGRGNQKAYSKDITDLKLEDRVFFLGEQSDMDPLYGASDLLLHPTYYDPCSLVVLEALGAGVPVITTRFNGASELINGTEAGIILQDPRDHTRMASALKKILTPTEHTLYRKEAARIGARNDFSKHVDKMEEWITTELQ